MTSSCNAPSPQHRDFPTLGVTLFIGNLLVMAGLGVMVKIMTARYPVTEVLFFRFAFAIVAFLFLLPGAGGFSTLKTNRPLDHAIRTCSGIASLGLFYFAISTIPLAEATTLAYAAPIFITVLSIPFLGEQVGVRRWTAVVIGFVGVVMIAQPGRGSMSLGTLAGVGSAFTGALVSIWLRRLNATENITTIGITYNLTGTLVFGSWCLLAGWVAPTPWDLLLLTTFGLVAGIQQVMFTLSYRYAEASFLAPFEYLILVLAAIIGYVFWGESPTITTWVGSVIIASSGIFVMLRTRRTI